jgi:hypothetical protein
MFPRSWRTAEKHWWSSGLKLGNNPKLYGCVPIDSDKIKGGEFSGTSIDGVCDPLAVFIERQQRQAAISLLPRVLWSRGSGGPSTTDTAVQQLLSWLSNIGSQVGDWEVKKEVRVGGEPGNPAMSMVFKVVNGTEYLVSLIIYGSKFETPMSVNASLLAEFVGQMPQLEQFVCEGCNGTPGQRLPTMLAAAASRMRVLELSNCGLAGSLPASWGNWPSLEQLILSGNQITGTLPEEFAYLSGLQLLDLDSNTLQGTLPTLWGEAQAMPHNVSFHFQGNIGMQGTVPVAWSHFSSGNLAMNNTQIGGCSPGGLLATNLPPCSSSKASLLALKLLLEATSTTTTMIRPGWWPGLSSWDNGAYTQPLQQHYCLNIISTLQKADSLAAYVVHTMTHT